MAAQNEVRWLLDTLVTAWPTTGTLGGTAPPDTVAFRNRDEPYTYYYPDTEPDTLDDYEREREQGAPTDGFRTVGVAMGSGTNEFFGNKPQYDVTTSVDVRIQEKTEFEGGVVDNVAAHKTLVANVKQAINKQIVYPAVDSDAAGIGRVIYEDLRITNTDYRSREFKDQYRTEFTIELRGKEEPTGGESDTSFEMAFDAPFIG